MTEPGLRERHKTSTRRALEDAALVRFARDGFDRTSVDAIAADAGVAPRTFFRYFATKDEVLDMGREERQTLLRACVLGLDPDLPAPDVVRRAVVALAGGFEDDRERVGLRLQAVASSRLLRGRVFDTLLSWEHTLARALAARGLDAEDAATLAAVGLAVFRTSVTRWLGTPEADLDVLVGEGFDALAGPGGRPGLDHRRRDR